MRSAVAGFALATIFHAGSLPAQEVRGRVVGVDSAGIPGALVEVLETGSYVVTRSDGRFVLEVPPGEWRIRATRLGYRADTTQLVAQRGDTLTPRIVLTTSPLQLRGISVHAARVPALASTVTAATVRQVPPVGEPDVFRAIVLLPTVSQPNDLKGRIHLAGGASDETGVRLDDHPLQDPFHLLGLFGAFNVAALERADVLVHHQPPELGGRLSGVIDLETRVPSRETEGEAVASLLTAGTTVSGPVGAFDVLASGRMTYLDRLAPLVWDDVPRLGFADGLVRVGRDFGYRWRGEVLGFATRDHFRESGAGTLDSGSPLRWGESLLGVRVTRTGGVWDAQLRLSRNRAHVDLDQRPDGGTNMIRSDREWVSAAAALAGRGAGWSAQAGVGLDRRVNRQEWVARNLIDEIFSASTPEIYEGEAALTLPSVFGQGALRVGPRADLVAGARFTAVAGGWVAAPRLTARLRISEDMQAEIAANRRYQFDAQLEEPIEGSVTAPLFLLDEPRRADIIGASLDWTPAEPPIGVLSTFELQAFFKHYPDRPRLPPRVPGHGREAGPEFPEFDRISAHSVGGSLSGRVHLAGDGLIQGSYTYQRVREEFEGAWVPTSWDAPHTLVLFGSARLPWGRDLNLNMVYHAHSGRAATPVVGLTFEPDLRFPGSQHLLPRYLLGERNSIRVPPYHRLDLGLRTSGSWRGGRWTAFAQIINVLGRENAVGYDWQVYFTDRSESGSGLARAGRGGLPFLPSVGVELQW